MVMNMSTMMITKRTLFTLPPNFTLNFQAKSMKTFSTILCLLIASFAVAQDEVPGKPQTTPLAITGGTVHTIDGDTIKNGTVVFEDGKITKVGANVELPAGVETINAAGKHVYPGLFEAHSHIGLIEIASIAATIDTSEGGNINSNAKAHVAVNPDSATIPVTRANGVLLALTCPSGGLISGQGSVIQLDGWTYEDLTIAPSVAMHVNWPSTTVPSFFRARMDEKEIREYEEEQNKQLVEIRDFFHEARAYETARRETPDAQPFDLRLEAMLPLLHRKQKMLVSADKLGEIESAVAFAIEQDVEIVILGGYDAPLCADLLVKHAVPVIVSAVYRNPRRRGDVFDSSYTLPLRLQRAGVKYCISGTARSETWNTRILPDHAATAVAYGLSPSDALRSITLSSAEILGVDDQVGSITVGKDATLFIADGDILEIKTHVTHAFVQGRKVDLRSKHTRLYEKYKQKYNRQEETGQ